MKNGINFENESIRKMVAGVNDKHTTLNQFSFIAVMLFALFMSQNMFSNSMETDGFTRQFFEVHLSLHLLCPIQT